MRIVKNRNTTSVLTFYLLLQLCSGNAQTIECGDWMPSDCQDDFLAFVDYTLETGECVQWKGLCETGRPIYRIGKVSIGTSKAGASSLTVTEGIVTSNVKICEGATWCDYVFEEDYELLPIEAIEKQIKNSGHLHKTPSAAEIEALGMIDIGVVTLDHQEKIEEIFLHLIQLKKKADILRERLAAAKAENKRLKTMGNNWGGR